ncbi:MAG: hypothetical protein UY62_C0027G0007, partial [Parcubacteria group bacterium GW2011_GWF2_50_9]
MLRFKRKHAVDATDAYRLIFAGLDIFNAAGGANENLGASLFLNPLPQIILEAITLKEGLGFNRAILFLADEDKKILSPMAWSIQKGADQDPSLPERESLTGNKLSGL